MLAPSPAKSRFRLVLIKPSHYDDDGYVIQWAKAWVPSNTLSSLYGITLDVIGRKLLGDDVEVVLNGYDETNTVIPVKEIIARLQEPGTAGPQTSGVVCLVGVQSNQFPRALDLARRFRAAGLQVAIGGFHPSGCLAMLPKLPPDLQEALDLGITLYAGEGEGRLHEFYRDALENEFDDAETRDQNGSGFYAGAGVGFWSNGPMSFGPFATYYRDFDADLEELVYGLSAIFNY